MRVCVCVCSGCNFYYNAAAAATADGRPACAPHYFFEAVYGGRLAVTSNFHY